MRISQCYSDIKGKKDSDVFEFRNKKFKYTVQMYTRDWTVTRRFFLKGEEIDVDKIPNPLFSAMLQDDNWDKVKQKK